MDTKPENIFKPNREAISLHLNRLFGDAPEGYEDGVIEISDLYESRFFNVLDIEGATECAMEWNTNGKGAYTTGSVLLPNTEDLIERRKKENEAKGITGKKYRALGEYFYYSNVTWIDLDEIENNEDFRKKYQHCQPNYYVITSKTQDKDTSKILTSVHFWWLLSKPCFDKEELERANKGILQNLGGDKGTHNCTRLMKIGGSIAWPKKAGRVTQIVKNKDTSWMPPHDIESIKKAYPVEEPETKTSAKAQSTAHNTFGFNEGFTPDDIMEMVKHVPADNDYFDWLSMGMALHDAGMPFEVWDAWSSSGAKYPGTRELRGKWDGFKKGGGITVGTLYYHAFNNGFRFNNNSNAQKRSKMHNTENNEEIDEETGEIKEEKPLLSQWVASEQFKGKAPEIEWLVEGMFPLGVPALLAAMGGLGKSFSILDMCIKIASPPGLTPHKAFGGNIMTRGKIVYFSAEDNKPAIHRRINKLINEDQLAATKANLHILPMPDIGPELFISENKEGIHTTTFYHKMMNEMKNIDGDIALIAIDPMQAFVGIDITTRPEAGQFVWTSFSNMAAVTGATVLFSHHMRKDGLKTIKTIADAREAIRGSTALVDGSRLTYAMWQADEETGRKAASKLDVEYAPEKIVQGAVVKTNDEADQQIHTYIREESGILKDRGVLSFNNALEMGLTSSQAGQALREIRVAWEDKNPFRASPQSPRCIVKWLMKTFKISRAEAIWQRDNWMCPPLGSTPLIEERNFKDTNRHEKAGLYVVNIP